MGSKDVMSRRIPRREFLSKTVKKGVGLAVVAGDNDLPFRLLFPNPAMEENNNSSDIMVPNWNEMVPDEFKNQFLQYQQEFSGIVAAIKDNEDTIASIRPGGNMLDIDLLTMYYPFYRVAQDRFNIPWHLLWITHDAESAMSTDRNAFIIDENLSVGAMQRNTRYYSVIPEHVTKGFEFLARFPQNHPTDWQEILFAASKLSNDAGESVNNDPEKDWMWGLQDAIRAYCQIDFAESRINGFVKTTEIFN